MKLVGFRIYNFRSINDSNYIPVDSITALVGRNESGKSNLLLALATLNAPGGRTAIDKVKNFPRGRRLHECTDYTKVVGSVWQLTKKQTAELKTMFPKQPDVTTVDISRYYGTTPTVGLNELNPPKLDPAKVSSSLRRLTPVMEATIAKVGDAHQAGVKKQWSALTVAVSNTSGAEAWAKAAKTATANFRSGLGGAGVMLDEAPDSLLAELETLASEISEYEQTHTKARSLVIGWMPTFIYIADFPELAGHQNLADFVRRRTEKLPLTDAEENFTKLAQVAAFDPKQIHELANKHEERQLLLNRAGALVTREMRRLWKDRKLTVRFAADGPHLDTLIYDETAAYPIEVNLDERSRGFRWFFSFYIAFSADTQGGKAANAVLLLDEPGLYLHARSQEDLLHHLQTDYENQIIYSTHSPFMIPPSRIEIARTVNIDEKNGTQVTKDPTGDERTLFPLQAALGYSISQTLFVGFANLVVEGVTDFWVLSSINDYLTAEGKLGLHDKMVLTPAGGAGKISYMVSLLASQQLDVIVLLDDDKAGRDAYSDLVKNKVLRETALVFASQAFATPPTEADIEDIIDPAVYETLVKATYSKELKGKSLKLNSKIPRIVKRYEEAFAEIGLDFFKTRPAREFMVRMGKEPSKVMTAQSIENFERLIAEINKRYDAHKAAGRGAFK